MPKPSPKPARNWNAIQCDEPVSGVKVLIKPWPTIMMVGARMAEGT